MAEINEIANRENDWITGVKRVAIFPASAKRIIDTTDANNIYVGVAAAGSATSAAVWFIEKINTSGSVVTITHATDAWDNRSSSASYS